MNKNSNQNRENVRKLTKYHIRLASADNINKQNIYKHKIKEYSNKLDENGLNSKKILQTIQAGGGLEDALNEQYGKIQQKIVEVENSVGNLNIAKIENKLTEIRNKYNTLGDTYNKLGKSYTDFVKTAVKGAVDIKSRITNVKIPSVVSNNDSNYEDPIIDNYDDKIQLIINEMVKQTNIDTQQIINNPINTVDLKNNTEEMDV